MLPTRAVPGRVRSMSRQRQRFSQGMFYEFLTHNKGSAQFHEWLISCRMRTGFRGR